VLDLRTVEPGGRRPPRPLEDQGRMRLRRGDRKRVVLRPPGVAVTRRRGTPASPSPNRVGSVTSAQTPRPATPGGLLTVEAHARQARQTDRGLRRAPCGAVTDPRGRAARVAVPFETPPAKGRRFEVPGAKGRQAIPLASRVTTGATATRRSPCRDHADPGRSPA